MKVDKEGETTFPAAYGEHVTLLTFVFMVGVSQSLILCQSNQSNRNRSLTAIGDDGLEQFLNGELLH
jgi:hypothetical protein